MKRKIIKQGHNTLTMTLPSEWVRKFNLQAGKEVDLVERDNGLFITSEKIGENKKAEFNITGMDIPTIWKYFMAVYREGYDEILVKFEPGTKLESPYKFFTPHSLDIKYKKIMEKQEIFEVLHGFVSRFIGMEIMEQRKDYVLIKEMGEISSKEFDNSLRRVFLILQQMVEETKEAITMNNPKMLSHMHDVDINLDKFHDYCIRVMNKTEHKSMKNKNLLFSTLYLIELTGDEFKNIAKHLTYDMSDSKLDNLKEMAELLTEQINLYYELFYKFDKEKVIHLSEIDKKMYNLFNPFYKKANEDEKEIFTHLRRISRYINALYELRIEMEY